jgi:hypothetical protein
MGLGGRIQKDRRMKHFTYGALAMAAISFALWVTWGKDAVRNTAGQPDQAAAVERCMLFWFGAATPENSPALRRLCNSTQAGRS